MVTETPTGPRIDTQDETLRKELAQRFARPAGMSVGGEDLEWGISWDGVKSVEPGQPGHTAAGMDTLTNQTDYSARTIGSN